MKLYEIVFSPTGGTKKAADLLAGQLEGTVVPVDLTRSNPAVPAGITGEDVAVIAVPSYGGRVPAVAAQRLARLNGNGARAILVCVYGNRAYEDTLAELEDVAGQAGFRVVAGVAAVAEHSIARQFAAGRPDNGDAKRLAGFAKQIQARLSAQQDRKPVLPGNRPYKKAGGAGLVPKPTG